MSEQFHVLRVRLIQVSIVFVLSVLLFLLWKWNGNGYFLLTFRCKKILMMCLVGSCIGMSTIVFQTLTFNRILTPAVIGLDRLYLLLQMISIFIFGGAVRIQEANIVSFLVDVGFMMLAAILLFGGLIELIVCDIYRLLLVGVILGILCHSLMNFIGRVIDPVEYAYFQAVRFAQFNRVPSHLLLPASFLIVIGSFFLWRKRYILDIISIGQTMAIGLGVRYRLEVLQMMLVVSMLVAVSTTLAGPALFFGLLVSALTYHLFPTPYHRYLLPAAALIASSILLIGQTIFERFLGFASTLSIVVEGFGGLLFLYFLLKRPS